MKILLIGEYSNVHATLAVGLRQCGHQVTVVSDGDSWKNYPRNIDVSRPTGLLSGLRLLLRLYTLLPRLHGYDVVQLINPMFFELKAERLFPIYRYLRRHNKKIVLGAMGMDWYWVHTCTFDKPLRYSDFNIGDKVRTDAPALKEQEDWLGTAKERLNKMIAEDCDGIVSVLYEDHICYERYFPEKTRFIPLPIHVEIPDIPENPEMPETSDNTEIPATPIKLFIGISRGRSAYKGTDIMLRAAEDIANKYPGKVELRKAEGVPFAEYQYMMDGSDAILDQLYSYTPSMNPLLAMSKGIICIGGGEPENYEILGEKELRPIINVQPTYDSVYNELEQLVLHPERIAELKQQSVEYVRRHHNYMKVARQYEQFYQSL